jgi:hypothetical protein
MIAFYFKDQRIEEPLRDEKGNLVIVTTKAEDGKTTEHTKTVDYKSIQLKVPLSMCDIDFDSYSRYSPMYLVTPTEMFQLLNESPEKVGKNTMLLATISYLEGQIENLKEQVESQNKEG